ncbi:MAG: uracil-DNA glycosylase [Alphaproteobacteria bacterium]
MDNTNIPPEPVKDCTLCPRLVAFRQESAAANPDWFNGAVPSFGPDSARLLIVGLAPGLKGANRTGRPFTGDYAGDLLYPTLLKYGFASGLYDSHPDDGLQMEDAMITNAVRCVPPQNKPTAAEATACRPFLVSRMAALPKLAVIIALGRIAHDAVLRSFGCKLSAHKFGHNAAHDLTLADGRTVMMIDSYHCSRYNTNTGRLTEQMFHDVFETARSYFD